MENCFDLLKYSETYHRSEKLTTKCVQCLLDNIKTISELPEFVRMSIDLMKLLVSSDRNRNEIEESLYSAVAKWLCFDLSEREKYIPGLLDEIHFESLRFSFFDSNIFENNPLLENKYFLLKIADIQKKNMKMFLSLGNGEKSYSCLYDPVSKSTVDQGAQCSLAVKPNLFSISGEIMNMFVDYNEKFSKFISYVDVSAFGYATFNYYRNLFVCGGRGKDQKMCKYYSVNENSWKYLPEMKIGRRCHRAATLNEKIYVCGGDELNTTEIFDINKSCWSNGPSLSTNMSAFGLCTLNGCIYAVNRNNFQHLDFRENVWRNLPEPSLKQWYTCSAVGYENYIYTFDCESAYTFDLRNNKWTKIKTYYGVTLTTEPHVCMMNNEIYLFQRLWDRSKSGQYLLQSYNPSKLNLLKTFYMGEDDDDDAVYALFYLQS